MAIEAVLFDIGGVLERNPGAWERPWPGRLGLSEDEFARRLAPIARAGSVGEIDLAEVERRIADAYGLDEGGLRGFMDDLWADYVGTLDRPVMSYFASLRGGYRTGLLSNSFVGAREREQAAYGFAEICDVIVYSHEVGVMKPEPTIYLMACERLRVRPSEALFVDDVQANVDGARAIGMEAIRFVDADRTLAQLRERLERG